MIAEWTQELTPLINQISEWSRQQEWQVEPETTEAALPNSSELLEKSGLRITTPSGRVHLEPAGRRADGKVVADLYAWPTFVRVRLLQTSRPNSWQVVTDAGIPFYWEWNKANFVRLVNDLQKLP